MLTTHSRSPLTLKASPSNDSSSSPRNVPSSRFSSYLLTGPRVGSWVISGRQAGREGRREGEGGSGRNRGEGGREGGPNQVQ